MGLGNKRNQPCFCGSGKKYKKCHLAQAGSYGTFKIDEFGRMIMSPGELTVEKEVKKDVASK